MRAVWISPDDGGGLKLDPVPGVDSAANLAGDDGLLGMEVAFDDGADGDETCAPTRTVPRTRPSIRTVPSV